MSLEDFVPAGREERFFSRPDFILKAFPNEIEKKEAPVLGLLQGFLPARKASGWELCPNFAHFLPLLATFDAKWPRESRQDVETILDPILDRASI